MSYLASLQDKTVYVLGAGVSGVAVARYLANRNISVNVFDTRTSKPNAALFESLSIIVEYGDLPSLSSADIVIVSPGLSLAHPSIVDAQEKGIEVFGDVELFARVNAKPVIAITGSNGKSTVTTLVGDILKANNYDVCVAGNIGLAVFDALDRFEDADIFVLELSSFQLETLSSLSPISATVLNVSEDHMDRYDSLEEYAAVKRNIYSHSQLCIFNCEDALTSPDAEDDGDEESVHTSFSALNTSANWHLSDKQQMLIDTDKYVYNIQEMKLVGLHNVDNILAALALTSPLTLNSEVTNTVINEFAGLRHRCELISKDNQTCWVNDSKATNVGATLAAIEGLKPLCKGRLILLAGGDGKSADFAPLASVLNQDIDELITFGKDGAQIANLKETSHQVNTIEDAVKLASTFVKAKDTVLLSPACASLDMFKNYEARGDAFCAAVKEVEHVCV